MSDENKTIACVASPGMLLLELTRLYSTLIGIQQKKHSHAHSGQDVQSNPAPVSDHRAGRRRSYNRSHLLGSVAGKFVSIEKVEKLPALTQGYVRWTFAVNFEKTEGKFTLVIEEDANQIEGVHFE